MQHLQKILFTEVDSAGDMSEALLPFLFLKKNNLITGAESSSSDREGKAKKIPEAATLMSLNSKATPTRAGLRTSRCN